MKGVPVWSNMFLNVPEGGLCASPTLLLQAVQKQLKKSRNVEEKDKLQWLLKRMVS